MPFELTESLIREHASFESFRRGEDYYRQGTVLSLTRRGGVLRAEVAGSEFAPYEVHVAFDEAGITEAACSCPYESVDYWQTSEVIDEVYRVFTEAWDFIEAGDDRNALLMLEAITNKSRKPASCSTTPAANSATSPRN